MEGERSTRRAFHPEQRALAAVFQGAGQPLDLQHLSLPQLAEREALVRVLGCTLCGSDLSTIAGHRQEPVPCILGHEILGEVVALGGGHMLDLRGRRLQLGDRLIWSVAVPCGVCVNCQRGLTQKCLRLRKYGHHRLQDDWQLSGGMADYCHLLAGTQCVVVDEQLSDRVLCPASCATATAAAAVRACGHSQGTRVLILGAGLLGLTAAAMLSTLGPASITVCDPAAIRREVATRFGASCTLSAAELEQLTARGRAADRNSHRNEAGFDLILEMSGNVTAVESAFALADTGARIVLVGSVRPSPPVELFPERVVRQQWTIQGVHNYHANDLLAAVDFLQGDGRRFPFEDLVTDEYPLQHIDQACQAAGAQQAIRVVIRPQTEA